MKTSLDWFHTISINERVAVLFTGGWYHGQIIPNANDDVSRRFIQRHGHEPSFRAAFDDKSLHAYKVLQDGPIVEVLDEDSTTEKPLMLEMYRHKLEALEYLSRNPTKRSSR